METVAKPLQWMEDFTVSTKQLKAAARKIPRSIITEVSDNKNESTNGFDNRVNQHDLLNDFRLELTDESTLPEVQTRGQNLFNLEFKVVASNDEEEERSILRTPKLDVKIKPRKIKKPINLWELGKGTNTGEQQFISGSKPAHENLRSYYKILKNQKTPSPDQHVQRVSPSSHSTEQPLIGGSVVKLPPINNTTSSQVTTLRHNTTQHASTKVQSQRPHKGNFLSFKPLAVSQKQHAALTLSVHRNQSSPRKPIQPLKSFSNLEVAPSNGTALAYAKAMTTIKYENEESITTNGYLTNKLHYPFRLSRSPAPLLYRTNRTVMEEEKTLAQINPNIPEQSTPEKSTSSVEVSLSENLNDQQLSRQIHKTASILESFGNISDEYLVRYDVDDKMKALVHKLRGGVVNSLDNLTDEIRSEYNDFMTEIDQITFYNLRQAEALLTGYSPLSVVLISSMIPRTDLLCDACKPGILSIVYDASLESYSSLIEKIQGKLNEYRKGAKIRYLAIVCKGGPGYMYLLRKNPITPPKLLKDKDLMRFWRDLGSCMSKISKEPSVVHLMESNVSGNKQGEMLLQDLEATIFAHKVKIESPLEISTKGHNMIKTYFVPKKFKDWKQNRYTE